MNYVRRLERFRDRLLEELDDELAEIAEDLERADDRAYDGLLERGERLKSERRAIAEARPVEPLPGVWNEG